RPPMCVDSVKQSWGAGQGQTPQVLFWEQVPEYREKLRQIRTAAKEIEASGRVPRNGMQRWQNTWVRSKPGGTFADLPGHRAWVAWLDARPHYLDVWSDGGSAPPHYREKGNMWGHVSPPLPLDARDADVPFEGEVAVYADWQADRVGRLAGLTGVPGLALSDFYDCHPHNSVFDHDFNPRIVERFATLHGIELPDGDTAAIAEFIAREYPNEWIDFWCDSYAYMWRAFAREIGRHTGKRPLIINQTSSLPHTQRLLAVDPVHISAQVGHDDAIVLVQTLQRFVMNGVYVPELSEAVRLGCFGARAPELRYGHLISGAVDLFWGSVAKNWPELPEPVRKELGWKRLKRIWLTSGWTHVATADGRARRVVEAWQPHYHGKGEVDPAWPELLRRIEPARPFGAAVYYSLGGERAHERELASTGSKWWIYHDPYTGRNMSDVTDLTGVGHGGFYVSTATLDALRPDFRPSHWIVPNPETVPDDERRRLEAIAPTLSTPEGVASETPLRFTADRPGRRISGYGFFDRDGQLVVLLSDVIAEGESNAGLTGVTATVAVDVPGGAYVVEDLESRRIVARGVSTKGTLRFDLPMDRWDTRAVAIRPR
ncbi:MAG: hypothetical protein AAGJ97_03275, partial [Planctomycetota bacterium]